MKISYNWLKQYVHIDLPAEEVARLLTDCGLEVEGIEPFQSVKGGLKGLVTGEVMTCAKHPNADKLSLTTMNVGAETLLHIVCGAPNVAAGQKVIVAMVGAMMFPTEGEPFEIKKSKIRGEVSEGMICAEDEIGLGNSHAGIMVLPPDTKVGMSAAEFFAVEEDVVFEIGLTPNRADAASHIGVARDLLAVLQNTQSSISNLQSSILFPSIDHFKVDNVNLPITVDVKDATACPRYSGITISGVDVKESPAWLKNKLKSIGVGPINNIVDITNYVLHECGQPLHAFDADEIKGRKVIVRDAKEGEKFITLDKTERTLVTGNLMICHSDAPMCMAGVFGGISSGISEKTKNIFLESAYFSPASIRKTSKHHGLKTDASFRFERGTDPDITMYALKRAAMMIREIAGGKISSDIIDLYPSKILPAVIRLDYKNVDQLIGEVIDRNIMKNILQSLGIIITEENPGGLLLSVPTHKVDVTREVDVVEEILRIYGYNKIAVPSRLYSSFPAVENISREKIVNIISDYLCSNGFHEIMTNSLTKPAYAELANMDADENAVVINPLSQDLKVMRQSVLHSGLEAIEYNRNRKNPDLKFFEFGKTYHYKKDHYSEMNHLALYLTGKKTEPTWNGSRSPVDFFFLKTFVKNIFQRLGIDTRGHSFRETPVNNEIISSGLEIRTNDRLIVQYGMVNKKQLKNFDISSPVLVADFNWDVVMKLVPGKDQAMKDISKFPQVRRDLSMQIDRGVSYAEIETIAYKTEKNLLKEIFLFDVYEGEKIEQGKKSYAVTFILQDDRQTLTDSQIDKIMNRLMEAFEKQAGALIRKQ
ncbi:MAG: phenylalanine--tRNA ligase subunit beta [Bacteroidetes bacterium]|nr:phenylalanine--tRNA ligase subunit beta [Bacteroidota bacterium]